MFKCDFCGKTTQPREKLTLITTETHQVVQPNVYRIDPDTEEKEKIITTEIAREEKACEECAEEDRRRLEAILQAEKEAKKRKRDGLSASLAEQLEEVRSHRRDSKHDR
jgi:hypothetical protein